MLCYRKVLFALRSETSLREPAAQGNATQARCGSSVCQMVKEQDVIACAKHLGLCR
jgi:hypothetical protein